MSTRINWSKDGTKAYMGSTTQLHKTIHSQGSMDILDAEPWTGSSINAGTASWTSVQIFNFPAPVLIDRVLYMANADRGDIGVEVSSDTADSPVPGVTGIWTEVFAPVPINGYELHEFAITTPTVTQWLRLRSTTSYADFWGAHYVMHLYGAYTTPIFELCDQAGTVITDPTFLNFSTAYSNANWTESKTFKIKNTDTADHTYLVTVDQQQTADVPFVTDHFTLTSVSSPTPSVSYTTPLVTSGGTFSEDIVLTGFIDEIDNPGGSQGLYYPKVTITEAS